MVVSLGEAPSDVVKIEKHEEGLALDALERSLELEWLEVREH